MKSSIIELYEAGNFELVYQLIRGGAKIDIEQIDFNKVSNDNDHGIIMPSGEYVTIFYHGEFTNVYINKEYKSTIQIAQQFNCNDGHESWYPVRMHKIHEFVFYDLLNQIKINNEQE